MAEERERVLVLVPAKGGSVRFPRKNIALLGGKTLLQWTVDAIRASGLASRIVLSTEDPEVARRGQEAGADVPFLRPEKLARDPAGIVDVALHALEELEKQGEAFDTVIITPPTCPFRTAEDMVEGYNLFLRKDRAFVMSVSEFDHTPFAAMKITGDNVLEPYFPDLIGKKAQEMPKAYRPNGAVHVLDVSRFREVRSYFESPLVPYVMPRERSVDIDNPADLHYAQALLESGAVTQEAP